VIGYDGFKKILGIKIHVAVDCNSLPVSIIISPANQHDSTKFIDAMESISDHLDDDSVKQIKSVYADKSYDSKIIRNYLKTRDVVPCIPFRNYKTTHNKSEEQNNNYNKTRFTVERFFA
jgi:cell division protein FtsX